MTDAVTTTLPPAGDGLVLRQLRGILSLELRRNLFGRRALALYFLAFAPVGLMTVWALSPVPREWMEGPGEVIQDFAWQFEGYLRTSVFLSTLVLFMSLFRSEILQRSLHYYLLTPVRRELLVAGKYLAAFLVSSGVFAFSTAALYLVSFSAWGLDALMRHLQGPGLSHLLTYVGIAILACAGYGAVFLLAGLFFRNPVVAAGILWGWELANFLLPPTLKKLSVVFYLQSLHPVPPPADIIAVFADPASTWVSVFGLLLFTAAVLAVAAWRARRMEIAYGGD